MYSSNSLMKISFGMKIELFVSIRKVESLIYMMNYSSEGKEVKLSSVFGILLSNFY